MLHGEKQLSAENIIKIMNSTMPLRKNFKNNAVGANFYDIAFMVWMQSVEKLADEIYTDWGSKCAFKTKCSYLPD